MLANNQVPTGACTGSGRTGCPSQTCAARPAPCPAGSAGRRAGPHGPARLGGVLLEARNQPHFGPGFPWLARLKPVGSHRLGARTAAVRTNFCRPGRGATVRPGRVSRPATNPAAGRTPTCMARTSASGPRPTWPREGSRRCAPPKTTRWSPPRPGPDARSCEPATSRYRPPPAARPAGRSGSAIYCGRWRLPQRQLASAGPSEIPAAIADKPGAVPADPVGRLQPAQATRRLNGH